MGRLLTLMMLVVLGAVAVRAQDPNRYLTRGKVNGVSWRASSNIEKTYFTRGASDGVFQGMLLILAPLKDGPCQSSALAAIPQWFANSHTTVSDHVKEMNAFYEDGANISVPIIDAYVYTGMKLAGASQQELDAYLKSVK
jgi:hypothetical protein